MIESWARTDPAIVESLASVAEVPTCQKTLHSCAPLTSVTVLFAAVTRVESVWKMKTEFGSLLPSRTSDAVQRQRVLAGVAYTPPSSVWLPISVPGSPSTLRPAASAYGQAEIGLRLVSRRGARLGRPGRGAARL